MEQVTIKKVAETAGVSVAAVSYVINGKKGVSEQTRERILDVIKELEYSPNMNSRRLVMQRSFNILVCLDNEISSLENLFYLEIIGAIVKRGSEEGYSTVLCSNDCNDDFADFLIKNIAQRNADGIIFLQDISEKLQEYLKEVNMPYVIVDAYTESNEHPCIIGEIELASYTATKYLLEHGHQKVGIIGRETIPGYYLKTFSGYKRALVEYGYSICPEWIQSTATDEASAGECMRRILQSKSLPTAIFCAGDIFAIGAMNVCQQLGFRVPEDISFIGIDDIVLSRYCRPALTTVYVDKKDIGTRAVELLDSVINDKPIEMIHRVKYDQLIERESVCSR